MSRTVRRKSAKYIVNSHITHHNQIVFWHIKWNRYKEANGYCCFKTEEEVVEKYDNDLQDYLLKFHTDAHWDMNAPAWYRRHRNRLYRNRTKNKMRSCLSQGDFDFNLDPPMSDVNWNWF